MSADRKVYVIGGHQTDFARNWSKNDGRIFDLLKDVVEGSLAAAAVEPRDIEVFHVANFTGELFAHQALLGGMVASIDPVFHGLPAMRHEAACASGSVAILSAAADIEAGRYDMACVVGIEQMRSVPVDTAAQYLGVAAWTGREAQGVTTVWPHMFALLADEYERRYGLQTAHLVRIAQINFQNARRNPNAQTRGWKFTDRSFSADEERNPVVAGRIRRHDCSQLTDGAAVLYLASERFARRYAARRGIDFERVPYIKGWGHRTAPMLFADKLALSDDQPYMFPHLRQTILDALRRAGLPGVEALDGIETHDCFTISEYAAIDHFGLTPPGQSWRAIEAGTIEIGGKTPINPSGGLMGGGHPIGATGVRQALDAWRQVAGAAGDYQIPGAKNFATLNIGGSATTTVSLILGL